MATAFVRFNQALLAAPKRRAAALFCCCWVMAWTPCLVGAQLNLTLPDRLDGPVPYIPPAAMAPMGEHGAVRISPDGELLAFVVYAAEGVQLQIAPTNNPQEVRTLQLPDQTDYEGFRWAFTNQHLLLYGDAPSRYLYSYRITDGSVRPLSARDGSTPRLVAVSEQAPTEVVVAEVGPQETSLSKVNLVTGARQLIHHSLRFDGFLVDAAFELRVAYQRTAEGGRVYAAVEGADETQWPTVMEVKPSDHPRCRPIAFDADGEQLYFVDARDSDRVELKAFDFTTGTDKKVATSPTMSVDGILMHPSQRTLQAIRFTGRRTDWDFVDEQVAADVKYLRTVAEGEPQILSRSLDDERWVVGYDRGGSSREYFLFDRVADRADYLFASGKVEKQAR